MTVVKIVLKAVASTDFMTPDPGYHFVAAQFRIRNVGSKVYDDAPSNGMKLIDARGQHFDADLADTTAGPSLPALLRITPGDAALGFVTFQLPNGDRPAKVQFTTDSGWGVTGEWIVSGP